MAGQFILPGALPCDQDGIPLTAPSPPTTAEIIVGSATTDGATMVTLAANTVTHLTVGLNACINTVKAVGTAIPTVTLVGTGSPTPPTNTVLSILSLATSTTNPNSEGVVTIDGIWIYSGSSTVAIKLNFGGASAAAAIVHGVMHT